ncbi:TPA: cell division protein ZapE [Legionella anisa]|uniref:Cell division protein ZapE n=1 Tax=Legionella anisa TaxID=28082 RepID=A0AAX0WXB4_9GAMM|nr:cell division protein ZapE [Legionella anisa]AWN72573.1 cell division protein ZapE [Legionella anisa]MBN5935827.1 AFG1 family ATPase [Legionella anisa]MCW8423347.1 cell division protein ZapE [Legionella anisa]MCW8446867.1 cell division protein ZapE [Legionella anisa]PNL63026.1 cell division protein ZapE [Legionella anisa]
MNVMTQYEAAVHRGEIDDDPLQRDILIRLQHLTNRVKKTNSSWLYPFIKSEVKGVYLYGPVGVGKTYLIDLFYDCLEEKKKARFHFHHFMQQVDTRLRRLQGQKNPLRKIAKELAKTIRVLCFDEFMVHDVAYAMILAELLQALTAHGVILVISSNMPPDDLYRDGVHRKRFLPAIAAIKAHCDVLYLNEQRDYRVGRTPLLDAYLFPLNEHTDQTMEKQFTLLAAEFKENGVITIQNREIPYLKLAEKAIWFSFDILCNLPRSQLDYLELADKFDTIFLSNIPVLTVNHTLQAIMFIHFIDVMYDRGINIIISAEVAVDALYTEGEMKETFKRTLSRLLEMQSVDYLARHPKRALQEFLADNS